MYLLIDPSERERYIFYCSNDLSEWKQAVLERADFPTLLGALLHRLQEEGIELKDLQGIAVITGKGAFTGDRIAVTTVNMLVFALSIPAVAVEQFEPSKLKAFFTTVTRPQYIVAQYSAPPNVGSKEPYLN